MSNFWLYKLSKNVSCCLIFKRSTCRTLAHLFQLFFQGLVAKVVEQSRVLLTVCLAGFDPGSHSQNINLYLSCLQQIHKNQWLDIEICPSHLKQNSQNHRKLELEGRDHLVQLILLMRKLKSIQCGYLIHDHTATRSRTPSSCLCSQKNSILKEVV